MNKNDFQINPVFDECVAIAEAEPSLEEMIMVYYGAHFSQPVTHELTKRYIDTLIAMKDPAGVM